MTNPTAAMIAVILDRSGSMEPLRDDTIGSFNAFLAEQQKLPGECRFLLVLFNDRIDHAIDAPIAQALPLTRDTYRPNSGTALLDAMGQTIATVGDVLREMPEDKRPGRVLVVVMTDGMENASKSYTLEQVRTMVEHQRSKYAWEFLFMGANMDSVSVASSMGVTRSCDYSADSIGVRQVFTAMNASAAAYRSSGSMP